MSYKHKLRAELRDIRALVDDPIGRARALGEIGTDDWVMSRAKDMIKAFAKNAELMADLAEGEAATEATKMAEYKVRHLVEPSGTLEDELTAIQHNGCIPVITLTIHGEWVIEIRAEDNFRFQGRGMTAAAAIEQAQGKILKYREQSGRFPMRSV